MSGPVPAQVTDRLGHHLPWGTGAPCPGRGRRQQHQGCSLGPEKRSRAAPRKRPKPPVGDVPWDRSQGQQELPWVERHKPKTQSDLAVQKKKIEEVETWLKTHIFQRKQTQRGSVLLLTGPPGCGKTATLHILAKDLGLQVQEWTNPLTLDLTKEDLRNIFGHDSSFHTFPSQAQAALFQDFLLRANKYNKLEMLGEPSGSDKKLILVEVLCFAAGESLLCFESLQQFHLWTNQDIPNQFHRDPSSLHGILRRFVPTSRCPLIFILSDNFSGDNNQRLLFPAEILQELCISSISFKPVAPTNMMKVLTRISAAEVSRNGEKTQALDRAALELLCRGCSGDIRSAINSLQFSSMKDCSLEKEFWSKKKRNSTIKSEEAAVPEVRKKNKSDTSEDQEIQAIGGKDASIFLFHALGKIIYCKRGAALEAEPPQLPAHLSGFRRDTLLIDPESIVDKSHVSGTMFNLYLHQNYVDFFCDLDDVVRASEYLSTADVLCSNWSTRPVMEAYSASVATRGVIHSNSSRAFAHQQAGMGFRPLHKPQWFLISKKYQENCLAARSLFSSFCLPPECLQTELLPYLAMLANPMRNQAQIAFIQDVGRLPLKRHFGRLKLEALGDKEPGSPELFLGEGEDTELESSRTGDSDPRDGEGLLLPPSPCSSSALPGSQPQPVAAQAVLQEEDVAIEEFDSD